MDSSKANLARPMVGMNFLKVAGLCVHIIFTRLMCL